MPTCVLGPVLELGAVNQSTAAPATPTPPTMSEIVEMFPLDAALLQSLAPAWLAHVVPGHAVWAEPFCDRATPEGRTEAEAHDADASCYEARILCVPSRARSRIGRGDSRAFRDGRRTGGGRRDPKNVTTSARSFWFCWITSFFVTGD